MSTKTRALISRQSSFNFEDKSGAIKLLNSYVGEVLERSKQRKHNAQISAEDDFDNLSFDEKINHPSVTNIPLVSKVLQLQSIWPKHTSERRRRIIAVCKRLRRNDGALVKLRLSSEGIDDDLLSQVSEALAQNKILQHLMLHHNAITNHGLSKLCKCIKQHPSLHTIWIGANRISDDGVEDIYDLLLVNTRIVELNISNKWPPLRWQQTEHEDHPHISSDGAILLAHAIANGSQLSSLCLAQQRIGDKGAKSMFAAITVSCYLRTLNLKGNKLTDVCCVSLATLFGQKQSNLEHLDLSENEITSEGIKLLAKPLSRNKVLQAFNLCNNAIDDVGMQILYDCLRHNHTLTTLATGGNTSNDTRAEELVSIRNRMRIANHTFAMTGQLPSTATTLSSDAQTPQSSRRWEGTGLPSRDARRPSSVAMALVESLIAPSDLGAYGRRIPSRGLRENGPSSPNPFQTRTLDMRLSVSRAGSSVASSDTSLKQDHSDSSDNSDSESSEEDDFFETPMPSRTTTTLHTTRNVITPKKPITPPPSSPPPPATTPLTPITPKRGRPKPKPVVNATPRAESPARLSCELGKTLGVPHIGSGVGSMPLRSATTRHRDSGNHLMYLRVLTPADPPGTKPYSIVQIAKDRQEEVARVKQSRQDPRYKQQKRGAMAYDKVYGIKETLETLPPPKFFDKEWKDQVRHRYPHGLDYAKGCTSIPTLAPYEPTEDELRAHKTKIRLLQRHGKYKKYKAMSDGAQSVVQEIAPTLMRKRREQKLPLSQSTVMRRKSMVHDLIGLRPSQDVGDIMEHRGLTKNL